MRVEASFKGLPEEPNNATVMNISAQELAAVQEIQELAHQSNIFRKKSHFETAYK